MFSRDLVGSKIAPKSFAILLVAAFTAATLLRQILPIKYGIGTILVGSCSSRSITVAPRDTKRIIVSLRFCSKKVGEKLLRSRSFPPTTTATSSGS